MDSNIIIQYSIFTQSIRNMKRFIFSTIILSLAFLFSCSGPEAPVFQKLENVKFKSASIGKWNFVLTADAVFNNPNPVGAEMTALDLDLFINGKKVSDITQNVTATIGGSTEFQLPIEIDVPMKEVFKDIKLDLTDILKKQSVEYELKGTATVSVAGVKVKVPIEYEDKEEIKLSSDVPLINF